MFGSGRRRREREVAAVPWWWHSIDVGDGVVTPGRKGADKPGGSAAFMRAELDSLALPDLRGKTVLDIGAFNGYYCFAAEERGAARVVALDWYAWSEEEPGSPPGSTPPGRAGFEVARRLRRSRVEPVLGDFMTMDLEALGRFDVVLFMGVLYHMPDPLGAMRRLAAVTSELAIVESQAIVVAGAEDHALTEFFPGDELNADPSNWFVPNLAGLCALCRGAGFERAEPLAPPPAPPPGATGVTEHYRAVVHAFV